MTSKKCGALDADGGYCRRLLSLEENFHHGGTEDTEDTEI